MCHWLECAARNWGSEQVPRPKGRAFASIAGTILEVHSGASGALVAGERAECVRALALFPSLADAVLHEAVVKASATRDELAQQGWCGWW